VTVVTLNNVTPPERFDTHPWTIARIEEAPAATGRNYFAEEVNRNVSPYPQLQDDWEQGLKRVGKAMSEASVGDSIGATDDAPQAIGEFPDTPYVSGMRW
jgi:hypothetical protein